MIAAHKELRERIIYQAHADKEAKIWLSKTDQETILAFEYMQISESLKTSYIDDFVGADTFIYEAGLASRQFVLEGHGVVYGGEFNYVSVGMMAAHYGHSLGIVAAQSTVWNMRQLITGEGFHNYEQMFSGAYWGGYGHEYYNQQQSR